MLKFKSIEELQQARRDWKQSNPFAEPERISLHEEPIEETEPPQPNNLLVEAIQKWLESKQ